MFFRSLASRFRRIDAAFAVLNHALHAIDPELSQAVAMAETQS